MILATSTKDCPRIAVAENISIANLRLQLVSILDSALSPGLVFLSKFGDGVRRVLSEHTVTVRKCLFSAKDGGSMGLVYVDGGSDWSFGLHELPVGQNPGPDVHSDATGAQLPNADTDSALASSTVGLNTPQKRKRRRHRRKQPTADTDSALAAALGTISLDTPQKSEPQPDMHNHAMLTRSKGQPRNHRK
eukprot:GILJ01027330.1.p1 GENE.GILJ01027330.1~~GILJ01027330.1.p1  ORF type:complete len:191 (-),score=9.82 GILJ01027330.1:257-829(-)